MTRFPSDSPPAERGNYMVSLWDLSNPRYVESEHTWSEAIWTGTAWHWLNGVEAKPRYWRHATPGELPTDPLKRSIGRTPKEIRVERDNDDRLTIDFDDGSSLSLYHNQDCCESVGIEDVAGDFDDLIGHPLLYVDEVSSEKDDGDGDEQWTFYTFRSHGGTVVLRWYGTSNGYYSTSVDAHFKDPP